MAGEHPIERDAERIEVAAEVDRAIHSPGLFGRHIGERAGDNLGRLGRLTLARQTRGDAEPGEPRPSVGAVDQDVGRLDVLVDEAALVRLAQGPAMPMARRRKRSTSIGSPISRSSGSPPGSTSSSAVRPPYWLSASGRAAHAASSSSLSSYSWERRSRAAGGGRSAAGAPPRRSGRPRRLRATRGRRRVRRPPTGIGDR